MQILRAAGIAAMVVLPGIAWPQDAGPYAGKWVGTMTTKAGGDVRVDLVLEGASGHWRMSTPDGTARSRVNPCLERDFPLVLTAQADGQLQFDIEGGKVINGCIDARATLNASGDNALQGRLGDGRALSFTRR